MCSSEGFYKWLKLKRLWHGLLMGAAILFTIIALLALGFCLARADTAQDVAQGNNELIQPMGFWQPWTELMVGRNGAYNLIYGTYYFIPTLCEPNMNHAMLIFWGQRWDNFVYQRCPNSPLIGWGFYTVSRCVERRIDFRNTLAALELESTYGTDPNAGGNYFGIVCWSLAGGYPEQLEQHITIIQNAMAQRGNDPAGVAGYYNRDRAAYMQNWSDIFWGVR